MPKVFISYRHAEPDEQLAAECARFLERSGLSVFLDTEIRIGQEWVEEIDRQLRDAQYFVVLLSEDSIRSDMVRQETALAHKLRKDARLRIFPVRVAFKGELPYGREAWTIEAMMQPVLKRAIAYSRTARTPRQSYTTSPARPRGQTLTLDSRTSIRLPAIPRSLAWQEHIRSI
jgi:TIR domain